MGYVKTKSNRDMVGKSVVLTSEKGCLAGKFEIGSIVKITAVDEMRGYTFEDKHGNRVIEAGFDGFNVA